MTTAATDRPRTRDLPGLLRLGGLSFLTGFSGAMMPGPFLVAVIGQTAAQGFRAVLWLLLGHFLLELVTVVLLIGGVGALLKRPRVRGLIGLIGGLALLWMAFDMLRSAPSLSLDLDAGGGSAFPWPKLVIWGAAVCAANPYFTGWWATVGAGQIAHTAPRTIPEYVVFFLAHEASDFAWYGLVGVLVIAGRGFLTDGMYRGLVAVCAILIGIIAVWFLAQGRRFLRRSADSLDAT